MRGNNRVSRGRIALNAYRARNTWGDDDENLTNLLADLMHLVDAMLLDREIGNTFDSLLDSARMHYNAEKNETETP